MKKLLTFLTLAAFAALPTARLHAEDKPAAAPAKVGKFKWYTSFTAAKKAAAEQKLPILVLFTGSDWCPYCIKFEKEVLSKKEFKSWAPSHVILYMADAKGGPEKLSSEGKKLMKEFGATGFPSLHLTDADGTNAKKLLRGSDPKAFAKSVEDEIASRAKS